jgi:hypothetical protein
MQRTDLTEVESCNKIAGDLCGSAEALISQNGSPDSDICYSFLKSLGMSLFERFIIHLLSLSKSPDVREASRS